MFSLNRFDQKTDLALAKSCSDNLDRLGREVPVDPEVLMDQLDHRSRSDQIPQSLPLHPKVLSDLWRLRAQSDLWSRFSRWDPDLQCRLEFHCYRLVLMDLMAPV